MFATICNSTQKLGFSTDKDCGRVCGRVYGEEMNKAYYVDMKKVDACGMWKILEILQFFGKTFYGNSVIVHGHRIMKRGTI